jgi:NAD-dependent deacetylase
MLPEEEWETAAHLAEGADLFLSIGTSAAVYPAAGLPIMAKRGGAVLVEINPERTPLTPHADEFLQGSSTLILPALVEAMETDRAPR